MSAPEAIDTLEQVIETFRHRSADETRILLASLRPPEVANILESFPPKRDRRELRLHDDDDDRVPR